MSAHPDSCRHHNHGCLSAAHRTPVVGTVPIGAGLPATPQPWWRQIIAYLRRWSGDDAYERYLADHQGHGHPLLSRREFYRRYLDHRAGGSRCC